MECTRELVTLLGVYAGVSCQLINFAKSSVYFSSNVGMANR